VDLLDEAMAQIVGWIEAAKLAPPRVTTYPLGDVAKAHADIESGLTVGKLVLIP
jgi:NADPH2:quinone reductase